MSDVEVNSGDPTTFRDRINSAIDSVMPMDSNLTGEGSQERLNNEISGVISSSLRLVESGVSVIHVIETSCILANQVISESLFASDTSQGGCRLDE